MSETVSQTASLIGQVIEDVTYEAMSPRQYQVQLIGVQRPPQYTLGGFFVFSDLRPGSYRLRIGAEGFQPQEHRITMPLAPGIVDSPPLFDPPPVSEAFPIFEQSGDNELVVIVNSLDSSADTITFDPVILRKAIRAGAFVLAAGFTTRLVATLDVGRVTRARLATVAGLTVGSIIRIIRGQSIRLKFDPYHSLPFVHTHIAGKVVRRDAPEIPLPGAQVRLTNVNGADVVLQEIVGARIATVTANTTEFVLGTETDLVSLSNDKGDYHLYFTGTFFENVTLEVTLEQYQTVLQSHVVVLDRRNSIDFHLVKS